MKFNYSYLIVVAAAALAVLPMLGVDYAVDSYAQGRETSDLQADVEDLSAGMQASVESAIASLEKVLEKSPSLCTPTFVKLMQGEMQSSLYLRQMLVENLESVQFCDALGVSVQHSNVSDGLSIPGRDETLRIATLPALAVPAIKISKQVGAARLFSAFTPLLTYPADQALARIHPQGAVRIALTSGAVITEFGDLTLLGGADADVIMAQSFAAGVPLRIEAAVPFAAVKAQYGGLRLICMLLAGFAGALMILLSVQYVRHSRLPAFDLERAIIKGELKPYYQPVIDLTTGRLHGCEVLCRWEKPNGQIVSPGVFIEYAEVTGLAIPMTLSLMQQVRQDLSALCRKMPDLKISINLFEGHFRDGNIVEDVQNVFGGSPIKYNQLVFEITERQELANSPVTASVIAGLNALGAQLAMDDAGTGHSSLAYMQSFGFDIIKIDRVFVDTIKKTTTQTPVLDALIAMARDLGADVVAEGVETEEQALYLRAHGVKLAQGFLFAPAIKPKAFTDLALALNAGGNADMPVLKLTSALQAAE